MKDLDFTLQGDEIQHLVITLNPNDSVIADISTMVCMDENISINYSYHDLFQRIMEDNHKWVRFNNLQSEVATIILSPNSVGKVTAIDLNKHPNLAINNRAFMCGNSGLKFKKYDNNFVHNFSSIINTDHSKQLLLHSKGKTIMKALACDEKIVINLECIMAITHEITCLPYIEEDREHGKLRTLCGPGVVWLQLVTSEHDQSVEARSLNDAMSPVNEWVHVAKLFDE